MKKTKKKNLSDIKVEILKKLSSQEKENTLNSITSLAKFLSISKVAVKKHIDSLLESKLIEQINPGGKPIFLRLTKKGNIDSLKGFIP